MKIPIKIFFTFSVVLVTGLVLSTLYFRNSLATTAENQTGYLPLISRPENTPVPSPTPTKTPIPTDTWLGYINFLCDQSNLPSVISNASWNEGCWLHSRYMVKNDVVSHDEEPSNTWYTNQGDEAAENSNVMVSGSVNSTDKYAIDLWMSGPFHGISILDPQLLEVGFGSYRESIGSWQMGASLDVSRGRTSVEPPTGTYPVMWPGNGQSTSILGYRGTEWPDPLTSCPGIIADYWNPSGPPIYLQIGSGSITPNVTTTSLKMGDTNLDHCVFDETNYANPSSSTQNTGRWILNTRDAIIIMPTAPFEPGKTYSVLIKTNGKTYSWSFTTEADMLMSHAQPDSKIKPR